MSESKELKKIKKDYGEDFMKMCRTLFNTLLEREGLLYDKLVSSFSKNSKTLYEDIQNAKLEEKFKNYIYSKVNIEKKEKKEITEKNPYEILDEAGYNLYECKTEKEIQEFKKYYEQDEELCTFLGGRLDECVVFWAVKKNAEKIKREKFKNPKREDEYGTSVMSIQFQKQGMCTVSIKNRYNDIVDNPDATYGNDLDRIAPGLTKSFKTLLKEEYGLKLNSSNSSNIKKLEMPGYVLANDGKYYKYNKEINRIYYCPGNIVIENGEAKTIENPESKILMDYFILDIKNKKIRLYDSKIEDSFVDSLQDLSEAKIKVKKNKEKQTKEIIIEEDKNKSIIIEIDRDNQIIGYKNNELEKVGDNFLSENQTLTHLELQNIKQVGRRFLYKNKCLSQGDFSELEEVGDDFLYRNQVLSKGNFLKLKKVGDNFLFYNKVLSQGDFSKLKQAGDNFLYNNQELTKVDFSNLEKVASWFLSENKRLVEVNFSKLEEVGDNFLYCNQGLKQVDFSELKKVRNNFLFCNKVLKQADFSNLEEVGYNFLYSNRDLIQIISPKSPEIMKKFSNKIEKNLKKQSKNISMKDVVKNAISQGVTPKQVEQMDKMEANLTPEKEEGVIRDE